MTTLNKRGLTVSFFFLFFPLYTTPWIIQGMIRLQKWAYILWAVFMGLLGILYPPTGDFYRYQMDYYTSLKLDFNTFIYFAGLKFDYILSFLSYYLGVFNLNFDLSRFIYNFIAYCLLGKLFMDLIQDNPNLYGSTKMRFRILILLFSFSIPTYLYRYGLSTAMFLYGAYYVSVRGQRTKWVFIILAVLNHFSFIVFLAIFIFHRFTFFNWKKSVVIGILIFSLFFSAIDVSSIFYMLPINIIERYSIYIDGYYAADYLEDFSWKLKLSIIIGKLSCYIICFFYIIFYTEEHKKLNSLVNGILLLVVISTPFATIHERILGVFTLAATIHILYYYKETTRYWNCIRIMFYCQVLSIIMGAWTIRRQLAISDISHIAYQSTFQVFMHTYDAKWLDNFVFKDGDFKRFDK